MSLSARHTEGIPNPGSREAGEQGCTCAVIDNHYGRGLTAGYGTPEEPAFWITGGCPLHALEDQSADEGSTIG